MSGKHTLRRNTYRCNCIPCSLAFDTVNRFSVTHEDGSKEVALSSVDLLLDDTDAFILSDYAGRWYCYNSATRCGNLNKHGLWETVAEELESNCLKKVERMNVPRNSYETVYSVPVIGHKIFLPPADDDHQLGAYNELRTEDSERTGHENLNRSTVKKIKRNPNQYLLWEGKYYDTDVVYAYKPESSSSLKAVGHVKAPKQSLAGPPGVVQFVKNVSYQNAMHRRQHEVCRIVHTDQIVKSEKAYGYYKMCGGWTQQSAEDYLEINLTYPRYVTHIGTTGAYPETTIFPTRRIVGKKRISRFRAYAAGEDYEQDISNVLTFNGNGIKRSKFAEYVNILKEDEFSLAWVTSYEVHYRHTVTNKWTLLCVTSANTDAFAEHVLDLRPYFNAKDGLLTQYLRIRPLEHHHRSMMRVSVYGVDPKHNCGINGSIQRGTDTTAASVGSAALVEAEQSGEALSADDIPTIEYTVVHGATTECRRYVHDGFNARGQDYRYYGCKNPKHLKNNNNMHYIRDQQAEFEYERHPGGLS